MPTWMRHFEGGCEAIVVGSYSDLYGGHDGMGKADRFDDKGCLRVNQNDHQYFLLLLTKTPHQVAWYYETQLTLLSKNRDVGEKLLQEYKDN